MCGFCGEIRFDGRPIDLGALAAVNEIMAPRGPDGSGMYQLTSELDQALAAAARTAARALDIPVTGLDFLVPVISGPEYVIIEANERPGLANHEPQPTAQRFIDTLGAMVKSLKPNGRLKLVPVGHWNARFAEGARCTLFTDVGHHRGTILPLKASGHTFGPEIDDQPGGWDHVELRIDERVRDLDDERIEPPTERLGRRNQPCRLPRLTAGVTILR